MKILITGGCGFIGSNFIINKIKEDKNVKILNIDKLTYAGNQSNLTSIKNSNKYKFSKGDICDINFLQKQINSFKPDSIIHFAAESHVDRSIDSPLQFVNTNVIGTTNLLISSSNYIKSIDSKISKDFRFIHVSTDEVYGSLNDKEYFKESTPYAPSSPYSASKASSDHIVRAWFKTYNFPAIITNCSNNYGPYQFPEKLIPLMIANCFDKKNLPVYGKGNNIRDWLHVSDHCNALKKVLIRGRIGETYNIGGNNEISNIEIVKQICNKMNELKPLKNGNKYEDLITFVSDRPGHDYRYAIDSSKIQKELNWKPKETFKTGISKTIEWYLENENWWRNIQKRSYNQERLGLIK
tara:strand:- start:813 stop:1871 length:1059 start_codon:yes stop_codon:yes gene_type:complete